jgi:hypothetical protein
MDFGRSDPRFGAFGEVSFEVARRMAYACLWLSEDDAGGDYAGEEGEEWRVGTRGGAHPGARTRGEDEKKTVI